MSEPSSNSWLPLVLAAAVGAGLAGASSYLMHVYVSKKLEDQAKQLRKVMTKELYWRMKLSEQNSNDHQNGDMDDFINGGSDVPHLPPRRNRMVASSSSRDRRRAPGMLPPTSPPANSHGHTGPQGTPQHMPLVHHPGQPQPFRPSPGMHPQLVAVSSENAISKSISPNNLPRFLSPVGSTPDLPSLNINIAGGHGPQGRPPFASSQLQAAGKQDGLPIRGVSVHSARGPEDLDDEEDDILIDEVEEEELEEEARRAEEALMAKQRQISESRASPRGVPGVHQGFSTQGAAALHSVVTSAIEGVVQGTEVADGKAANGPVLHSLSMIQDNVHHPVSDPRAADILRKKPEQEDFVRVNVAPLDEPSAEDIEALKLLQQCLALRDKYLFQEAVPAWRKDRSKLPIPDPKDPFRFDPEPASDHIFEMEDGVIRVYANKEAHKNKEEQFPVWDATTFFTDMHHILRITSLGPVRTLSFYRLKLLEQKFHLHLLLNADREFCAQKSAPHRDLYNVRKVDTHVHHSACMNQKHLLRFIKSKLKKEPDEVVIFRDGKFLTLKEVFESLDLSSYDLNVDLLDVHADKNTFHRFDKFNLKYNPCGQSRLREIFIKQENLIQGRFLAELTKEVFTDLVASKYQMAEYRISIYGRKKSEWDNLASWAVNNELACENVVWLIQLPRLYSVYKEMGIMQSFQVMLDNVFVPLFEVTIDPASHPHLHVFLKHVVGFDMVDDESKPERRPTKHMPTPAEWTNQFNPAFSYYTYYVYANLYVLNKLRESKNMSIIRFRPHCGEAGDIDHLAAAFMTSHNIAHGNNLRRSPALQYLYYLKQIGLAMSPLSNNSLFLDYHKNPFPTFFARGLNVSLSTDDPLMIHLTKEPLVEEYSIAAQVWRLSSCDLCEVARNSVYQSGFWHPVKEHWVGPLYYKRGHRGNDIQCTNVPHIRMEFRHQVWRTELMYVYLGQAYIPDEVDY